MKSEDRRQEMVEIIKDMIPEELNQLTHPVYRLSANAAFTRNENIGVAGRYSGRFSRKSVQLTKTEATSQYWGIADSMGSTEKQIVFRAILIDNMIRIL